MYKGYKRGYNTYITVILMINVVNILNIKIDTNNLFAIIFVQLPDKSIASLVKYYYSWKKTRTRTSLMDRQARKLTSGCKEGENGSENGSELGSNTDSESEEKVRVFWFLKIILINFYACALFLHKKYPFCLFFLFIILTQINLKM